MSMNFLCRQFLSFLHICKVDNWRLMGRVLKSVDFYLNWAWKCFYVIMRCGEALVKCRSYDHFHWKEGASHSIIFFSPIWDPGKFEAGMELFGSHRVKSMKLMWFYLCKQALRHSSILFQHPCMYFENRFLVDISYSLVHFQSKCAPSRLLSSHTFRPCVKDLPLA